MIYAIRRYPVHLVDVLTIGASRVTIRPTLPQDIELQRTFFRALSPRARGNRFLTPLRELPPTLAESFVSIDYRGHLALLAEVFEQGCERMIAEARYIVDPGDPALCEFAIAVADEWQGLGLGRSLLVRLERQAAASGIHRMTGTTLITNRSMLALARLGGYSISVCTVDPAHACLEKHLADHVTSSSPCLPTACEAA